MQGKNPTKKQNCLAGDNATAGFRPLFLPQIAGSRKLINRTSLLCEQSTCVGACAESNCLNVNQALDQLY